ncbi:MAG TPA: hypothetical protein VI382_01070 [Candidatus Manganitrophaceae bacterium]|nr:hypothetical protein [Candidatus Manganitrophaceae bacterium]
MSSKIGFQRVCRALLLFLLTGVGLGCGNNGGGSPSGSNKADAQPPLFGGLNGVSSAISDGNVELTSDTASDAETPSDQLVYLIYVSASFPVDRSGEASYTFKGAESCAAGPCRFVITDLAKDGTVKYYFASRARDAAGNLDADPHPMEENGSLSASPLKLTSFGGDGGGGPSGGGGGPTSLNVDPNKHAVHPSLTINGGVPYVIWEECPPPSRADPSGVGPDHPCDTKEPSQIFMKRWNGSAWEQVSDIAPSTHSHSPTLTSDGADVYAAWREYNQKLFVQQYNGTEWTDIAPLENGGDRPALSKHPALGGGLGTAYEFSPGGADHRQLFFRLWDGGSWTEGGSPLNADPNQAAEAPSLSRNGPDLYIAWKETTVTVPLAGSIDPNAHSHRVPNIFVRKWNGASWGSTLGGSLNIETAYEARFPSIDLLRGVPYVAWHECKGALPDGAPSCGHEHIFVKHWDGTNWIQDKDAASCPDDPQCGSLNHRSPFAKTPSLGVFGNQVFVAWSEKDKIAGKYQIRLKSLSGDQWNFNGTLNIDPDQDAHSPVLAADGALYAAWIEKNADGILQLYVARH